MKNLIDFFLVFFLKKIPFLSSFGDSHCTHADLVMTPASTACDAFFVVRGSMTVCPPGAARNATTCPSSSFLYKCEPFSST